MHHLCAPSPPALGKSPQKCPTCVSPPPALGQSPQIVAVAAPFLRLLVPSLVANAWVTCLQRFLQAQGVIAPVFWLNVGRLAIHVPATFFCVRSFGLLGAAIALSISGVCAAFLCAMLAWREHRRTLRDGRPACWQPWSSAALQGWGIYLSLALPCAAMLLLEWASFEAVLLLAGVLPSASPAVNLTAMGLFSSILVNLFSLPFGFAVAVGQRTGSEIGAGRPAAAQLALAVGVVRISPLGCETRAILNVACREKVVCSSPHAICSLLHCRRLPPPGNGLCGTGRVGDGPFGSGRTARGRHLRRIARDA